MALIEPHWPFFSLFWACKEEVPAIPACPNVAGLLDIPPTVSPRHVVMLAIAVRCDSTMQVMGELLGCVLARVWKHKEQEAAATSSHKLQEE
jgi:hypothetical protein